MQDAYDKAREQVRSMAKQRAMLDDAVLDTYIRDIVKSVPDLVRNASALGDSATVLYLGPPGSPLVTGTGTLAIENLASALKPFTLMKTASKYHMLLCWA
jgi:hypothetical protein